MGETLGFPDPQQTIIGLLHSNPLGFFCPCHVAPRCRGARLALGAGELAACYPTRSWGMRPRNPFLGNPIPWEHNLSSDPNPRSKPGALSSFFLSAVDGEEPGAPGFCSFLAVFSGSSPANRWLPSPGGEKGRENDGLNHSAPRRGSPLFG